MSWNLLLWAWACTSKAPEGSPPDDSAESDSAAPAPPSCQSPTAGTRSSDPNLIVLTIDTLRVDQMGRYSGSSSSPFLDGLMADGLSFDRHRSCSNWTYPSFVCMLGGGFLMDLNFIPNIAYDLYTPLPDRVNFLAEYLEARGYRSAVVSSNSFLGEGFDTVSGYESAVLEPNMPADDVIAYGLKALPGLMEEGPWMLHLHFMDLHAPNNPPPEYLKEEKALPEIEWDLGVTSALNSLNNNWEALDAETQALVLQHIEARYQGTFRYLDDQLRALFDVLEDQGALTNTVVLSSSDHGEQFFDHGFLGHNADLYEEENQAIAFFWGEGIEPSTCEIPTTHADILPALYRELGWEMEAAFEGPLTGPISEDRLIYSLDWRYDLTQISVIDGPRKVLYYWKGDWEFYNLDDDPGEENNLVYQVEPSEWGDLRALLIEMAQTVHEDFFPDEIPPIYE